MAPLNLQRSRTPKDLKVETNFTDTLQRFVICSDAHVPTLSLLSGCNSSLKKKKKKKQNITSRMWLCVSFSYHSLSCLGLGQIFCQLITCSTFNHITPWPFSFTDIKTVFLTYILSALHRSFASFASGSVSRVALSLRSAVTGKLCLAWGGCRTNQSWAFCFLLSAEQINKDETTESHSVNLSS